MNFVSLEIRKAEAVEGQWRGHLLAGSPASREAHCVIHGSNPRQPKRFCTNGMARKKMGRNRQPTTVYARRPILHKLNPGR